MEFNEVHKYEVFDAVDIDGNKLNIDLIRGQKHENGLYHIIIEIITMNEKNQILVTQRHPRKNYGLYWEITGGSILKGETIKQGAIRELKEETNLLTTEDNLKLVYEEVYGDGLFKGFIHKIGMKNQKIVLQADETIDYQWVDPCEFVSFINRDDFIPHTRQRILRAWEILEDDIYCK